MADPSKTKIENTGLWQKAFGGEETSQTVSRLVSSLRTTRDNAAKLTSRIAGSLPGLTIHDVSHLDALWEIANTVVGEDFPLNPLEGYVFGAAVLLHDAALCFEAYEGGKEGLRRTIEWRDAHARLTRTGTTLGQVSEEADFEALRTLHASRASRLAIDSWGEGDDQLFLIDDRELRENYGQLIGELASSHHWDLEAVVARFSTPRPPASFLDGEWIVDALKIAFMLRVADAGHMDGARAPSFLLRLLQMNSISRTHWSAQNRLGRLTPKPNDPSQLIMASTSSFPQDEAAAWWVAFDLVETFDQELRHCNDALRVSAGGPRPTFEKERVAGAGQVKELSKYIETAGWEPTDSSVHVSDVSSLVGKLGGEQLYGTDADRLNVALRELVQNAVDAVCARRVLDNGFMGCITIRLRTREDGGRILQVDDDGVGMSKSTLSNDLLDFGRSFWASERAAREFPGVHASGYRPIGRFGIGFFSIFMAATKVKVFSRRFDKGLNGVRCLSFDHGLSLRPTLGFDRPDDFGMDLCTRVELELKPGLIPETEQIEIKCNLMGYENFAVRFKDYVASTVAGVDVPVFVDTGSGPSRVHDGFPPDAERRADWFERLAYLHAGVNKLARRGLMSALPRLREVRDGDRTYGLAALEVMGQAGGLFLSAKSVGGLVDPHNRFHEPFVGLIDHFPSSAQRAAGEISAPKQSLAKWMEEQIGLLKRTNLTLAESVFASYSISDMGFDPIDVLQGLFIASKNGPVFLPLPAISSRLGAGLRLGFPVAPILGDHLDHHTSNIRLPDIELCMVLRNGPIFNDAKFIDGVPKEKNSLVGIVHRVIVRSGRVPVWSRRAKAYTTMIGQGDCLEVSLAAAS